MLLTYVTSKVDRFSYSHSCSSSCSALAFVLAMFHNRLDVSRAVHTSSSRIFDQPRSTRLWGPLQLDCDVIYFNHSCDGLHFSQCNENIWTKSCTLSLVLLQKQEWYGLQHLAWLILLHSKGKARHPRQHSWNLIRNWNLLPVTCSSSAIRVWRASFTVLTVTVSLGWFVIVPGMAVVMTTDACVACG